MAIINYTTTIDVGKTAGEIQAILSKGGASAILCEYDDGTLVSISFKVKTAHGLMAFLLPANIDGVHGALQSAKKIEAKFRTREHAFRVAWRIIKDWIEAQMAIIESGMVTLPQVFLPYAQNDKGQTVYQIFEKGDLLKLEGKK